MKNRTSHFIGVILAAFGPALLWAGSDTTADFLKIPIGAQAAAVGQAYTALAEDVSAMNWNPAGIAVSPGHPQSASLGLSFSHQEHFEETNLDHIGLLAPARRLRSSVSLGLNIVRLSYPEQDERGEDREKTGSFKPSDMAVGALIATTFRGVKLGSQIKYIRQDLGEAQSQGWALDLGFLSPTPLSRISIGGAVRNWGPKMKFADESYDLPMSLSIGMAYRPKLPLVLTADLHSRPYQGQTLLAFGTEFNVSKISTLRAGYLAKLASAIQSAQSKESNRGNFGGVNGLSGGVGMQFERFGIDYSISPFGELGTTQNLTINTWFGASKQAPTPTPVIETIVEPKAEPAEEERSILLLPSESSDEEWWDGLKP